MRPSLAHLVVGPVIVMTIGVSAAGCDDDGDGDTGATGPTVASTATTTATTMPPADTEFCQEMVALAPADDRPVDDEDVADAAERVLTTYRSLVDDAPIEISSEMEAVIDRIERQLAGETLTEDELVVADESAYRIAVYVDLNCEEVANNPGPPPTAPE